MSCFLCKELTTFNILFHSNFYCDVFLCFTYKYRLNLYSSKTHHIQHISSYVAVEHSKIKNTLILYKKITHTIKNTVNSILNTTVSLNLIYS